MRLHLPTTKFGGMWKIPLARGALELPPGATVGMAIGAQIAQPEPAAIATARMRTEVL